jgi:hypothetical protein
LSSEFWAAAIPLAARAREARRVLILKEVMVACPRVLVLEMLHCAEQLLKTQKNIFLLNNQLLAYRFAMAVRRMIAR